MVRLKKTKMRAQKELEQGYGIRYFDMPLRHFDVEILVTLS